MSLQEVKLQADDITAISRAIKLHIPLEIVTYTLPHSMELYISEVMAEFLTRCHQEHMIEPLKFCMGELLTNSKKANTKRIYFLEKNLDINDDMQYNDGMISFKADTLGNINHYLEEQKRQGLYIKTIFQLSDDNVSIQIRNKAVLTAAERRRINEKIKLARRIDNVADIYVKLIDQTEGAGLGIIILMLMLEKIGLSKENFRIYSNDYETITSIVLPVNQEIDKGVHYLVEEFANSCTSIPVQKAAYDEMCELVNRPDFTKEEFIRLVSKDASLTALLLRTASERNINCCTYTDAIDIVGLQNMKSVFFSSNPLVSANVNPAIKEYWDHAYNTAFTAYNLALNFYPERINPEEIYVQALFHDCAVLMQKACDSSVLLDLKEKAKEKGFKDESYELFRTGSCHGKCGKYIIEKLSLSDKIATVSEYHNNPTEAPEDMRRAVYIIYLAVMLNNFKEGIVQFYQIEPAVLSEFNIQSEEDIKYILEQIASKM